MKFKGDLRYMSYSTLTELMISRKNEENTGMTFILNDSDEVFLSYGGLYRTASGLLYELQQKGFRQGEEIIFQIDDNRRFVCFFWACILGGMIPVPVTPGTNDEHKLKLFRIWNILCNPRIAADRDFFEKLEAFAEKNQFGGEMNAMRQKVFFTEDAVIREGRQGDIHHAKAGGVAFIQFSSGSTGSPKGIMITHKNVLTNTSAGSKWAKFSPEDSSLSWMPLTHDMGLIGTHITDVLACINQYNIHTRTFVRHPTLWMQKASEHRVTLLYSPNFGFKHFLQYYHPEDEKNWDLSCVRLIYNGAEPISADLCNEFLDKMAKFGLKRNSMYPVYGLAEGTIAVAFPQPGEVFNTLALRRDHLKIGESVVETGVEDQNGVVFVDLGHPIFDCFLRICDERNNSLGENRVGYIQICGGNVTPGYYNDPEATGQAFTPDGWLNTGDLGLLRNGRLIVTGRAKDILFLAGQNYYSHDIERVAECVEGAELGKVAAVGAFNEELGCDGLVLFVLFKQKLENFISLAAELKSVISLKLGIDVSEAIPVKSIPKTTSGKVQRYMLRDAWLNGEFNALRDQLHRLVKEKFENRSIAPPKTITEERLAAIWTDVLGIPVISVTDDFFALGGDSIRITQMISRIRDEFQVELEHGDVFENPQITRLAGLISASVHSRPYSEHIACRKVASGAPIPLSFAQQRLWFLDRLNGESRQYNLHAAFHIQGRLERDVLQKSLNEIIKRHTILQTSFVEEDGRPVGKINPCSGIEIGYADLSSISEHERRSKTVSMAIECAIEPFELDKAPLIRGSILYQGANEFILVIAVHHIVFDGWSFGILLEELSLLYEAFLSGREPALPELEIQYSDFAGWQLESLGDGSMKKQMDYWKEKLSGRLPAMDLPADRQRPAIQRYDGAKLKSILPEELTGRLQVLAKKEKATLFMVLLAAFKALIYRYTGQEDIIVGSPAGNRDRRETEKLVGFFINNLVLRTEVSGRESFRTLLEKVKKTALEAYSNRDIPFEKLVEELKVERDMSRNPLFQVLFSLQNIPQPSLAFSGIALTELDIDSGYSRFDLSLDIREKSGGLEAAFEYNTDLFNSDTISRMAGHYHRLLESICRNPGEMLDKLEILTEEEKTLLLKEWNHTEDDIEKYKSWTELFEAQAAKTPEAAAVMTAAASLTYGELNSMANRLAHYLFKKGVGPETVVGIYMNRSAGMLAALIAIHKARGAYLPMDPIFPKERLAYMLEDAQVRLILTENAIKGTLPSSGAEFVCIDDLWEHLAECEDTNPTEKGSPDNLAYLIYTSGSTGKPKGVQIEQHSLNNFLQAAAENIGLKDRDRLLAVTTLSFDIAGLELFMPLIAGACVVLAGREEAPDGNRLAAMLDAFDISIMQATPATWRLLIECGWKGKNGLKALCGGEALPPELAMQLGERCSVLWNMYGPTETTIWSTMDRVEDTGKNVTIGRPIANTLIYILDSRGNPVPVGVSGELHIGGQGVARGYLKQPELTKEKFIVNPFLPGKDGRIYKTGDLARYLPDGKIEFMGRMDHQVKIRGFRIETGEIEAVLADNSLIRQCVVALKEVIKGEKALVAYLIPASEQTRGELTPDKLRSFLREKLPDYMIPSAFIVMDEFPKTPNGKIDRKALPLPENSRLRTGTDYAAPANSIEKRITAVWQEVLKLDRIGANDNFFDLGGHSLLLVQVSSRLEKELSRKVPVMELFKYPTIHTLSSYLAKADEGTMDQPDIFQRFDREKIKKSESRADIAVIGMSGRFPGAKDVDEFWNNLCNGKECISFFTEDEAAAEGIDPETFRKPGYVKAWGILEDIDRFDAGFFGYNPREAEVLDPQQRIFLEEAWKALENSGYDPGKYPGAIGVYASTGMNTYMRNLTDEYGNKGLANDYQIMISNDKDFIATRAAYKLNLQGPAVTVQTACSSSLVAIHMACRSLEDGECDMALAGGVSIKLPQKTGYLYQEGMILSADGHCRAFDESAGGTVGGNGAGIVVLKRLEDAVADGDPIEAVIKGTAINNDGALKVGYTAPRIDGQAKAIAGAYSRAGVDLETVTCIEAHGTGTPLGDPIEIEALKQVFAAKTDKKGFCAVGSVKTNIGHLDAAAGVTGFIKTVLALKNGKIPPSLNYNKPNPKIDFQDSPFYVNSKLREWKKQSGPLRAGVSSFGIGGTNAHAVLEEAPPPPAVTSCENGQYLLVFSAKSEMALDRLTENFADHLQKNRGVHLADAAYTLQMGRREFEFRRFLVCSSCEDAVMVLKNKEKYMHGSLKRIYSAGGVEETDGNPPGQADLMGMKPEEVGHLWLSGGKIHWEGLYGSFKPHRIPLPPYPFEGKSYWVKKENSRDRIPGKNGEPLKDKTAKNTDIPDWFYTPVWKQSVEDIPVSRSLRDAQEALLVLTGEHEFSKRLAAELRDFNTSAVIAAAGKGFEKADARRYLFDPENRENYDRLIREMDSAGRKGLTIVNLFGITDECCDMNDVHFMDAGNRIFYSLLYLAQALGTHGRNLPVKIKVLTNNAQKIFGEKGLNPVKALAEGPCRVIPREYPNVDCTVVDLALPESEMETQELIEQVSAEICFKPEEKTVAYRGGQRWVRDFEKVKLEERNPPAIQLRHEGTYMITGGLGGIGLALAEYLARQAQARLVLLSRSSFPGEDEWSQWLESHGREDRISQKIRRLADIRKMGGDILVCRGDVTDGGQLEEVRKQAEKRFGRLDGLIHAAGIPGGGMIQLKKPELAEKVLAPKLQGTMALYHVFKDSGLDFFILCSSLNAITGGFGQVDYSAANAFLDAFARIHDSFTGTRYISINWDRWPGTGMAIGAGRSAVLPEPARHPLMGRELVSSPVKTVYHGEFNPEKDWILSEHIVMGTPTVAGTTYLEMARAAFADMHGQGPVEISEVVFLTPMAVRENETRDVFFTLNQRDAGYDFQVASRLQGAGDEWQEHAHGKIAAAGPAAEKKCDPAELAAKCDRCVFDSSGGSEIPSEEFIRFGSRWRSLKKLWTGGNEGFVEAELNSAHREDLREYKLHPALLDVVTGSVRLAAGGNYLPFSYGKLRINGPLPEKLYGRIKFKDGFAGSREVITCDMDILDAEGRSLVEISGFSMKLIGETAAKNIRTGFTGTRQDPKYAALAKLYTEYDGSGRQTNEIGITETEGVEVFKRVLGSCMKPQIIVSTRNIQVSIEQASYMDIPDMPGVLEEVAAAKAVYPRPELSTEYVPPKNETEKKLVLLWQDVLGIEKAGIHDEFFELGGDSLLLIQFHTKLKDSFKTDIAVVDLYKYNTIAALAKYLNGASEKEATPAFTEVNLRANRQLEQLEMIKKRRQQMGSNTFSALK